jgi:hypothetical protein
MVKVTNRLALSRDLVIRSAISYVDENGLPALTMRRLGHSLGVETSWRAWSNISSSHCG